jgi:hypothetical protein
MRSIKLLLPGAVLLLAVLSCNLQKEADAKFGDQHFKTAIALIELHKIRFGEYPKDLNDLKFVGEWDRIIYSSVEYIRLEGGYELNISRGWVARPELEYPPDFWKGLGLIRSNVKQGTDTGGGNISNANSETKTNTYTNANALKNKTKGS